MHNYLLLLFALLKQHGLIGQADAEKLAKELESQTLPGDFGEMTRLVENLYKRLGIVPKHK